MSTYAASALLALATSLVLTPLVRALALRLGLVDAAARAHRKVHVGEVPRLGGVAIVAGAYAPLGALLLVTTDVGNQFLQDRLLALGMMGGGLAIAALGLYDDLRGSGARLKFLVQAAVAVGLVALGFRIDTLDLPLLPLVHLGPLAWPVTVLWIVGVTNAVNLIDGLDGLAAGVALVALAPMTVLAIVTGEVRLALVCCALAGSTLGFLYYNRHPARIFMGDSGAMFLGFMLAVVTVQTSQKGPVSVALLTPVLALGMPIMDTLLSIGRRAWHGQPLFQADRGHIHHRLLGIGLSHRQVVLVMYAFAAAFALAGLAVSLHRSPVNGVVLGLCALVAGLLMRRIGYFDVRPRQVRSALALAMSRRTRNRELGRALGALDARLARASGAEQAGELAQELARVAGARAMGLELAPSAGHPVQGPARAFGWREPGTAETDGRRLEFALLSARGGRLGRLWLEWPDGSFDDGIVHQVGARADRLARAPGGGEARGIVAWLRRAASGPRRPLVTRMEAEPAVQRGAGRRG